MISSEFGNEGRNRFGNQNPNWRFPRLGSRDHIAIAGATTDDQI